MSQTALQRNDHPKTNLVSIDGGGNNNLAKLNMRELKELATVFVESGAFPDIKQVAQAMVKIIAGQELGFSPIVSMTGIHFFQGKVEFSSTLKAALIKDSGKYEYKVLQHTNDCCEIAFYQRIGNEIKSLGTPVFYTFEDAVQAGLTNKDNWKKYRKDMLFAACIRQGTRRYCADVLRGVSADTDIEPNDDGPIDQNALGTSAMDDQKAENVTVDAESVEAVDMETGEVIEVDKVDPSIHEVPADTDPVESTLADLIESAHQRLGRMTTTDSEAILGGRKIAAMDLKQIIAFHKELDKKEIPF
jgi:hypothetical protein